MEAAGSKLGNPTNLPGAQRRSAASNARERVLSAAELRALWLGLPTIYPDLQRQLMVRLILLTGCRKMEVQAARIEELALDAEATSTRILRQKLALCWDRVAFALLLATRDSGIRERRDHVSPRL